MAISTQAETRGGQITPEPRCLLEFRNIRIVYDNAIEAIRDVSIAIPEGGIVALLGSNGAGKSTLLKPMSGILYTEEGVIENGTIRFRDRDVHRLAPDELVRRGIVQVPEGRRVFPALTIDENLQMGGYTRTPAEARDRRDHVFALFPRLFERRDQIAGYMSGGEQQMLAIGRALMTGPVLLALDEPSLGLAPLIIDRIYEVIVKLRDEMKMTVLLVEQNAQRAGYRRLRLYSRNRARRSRRHRREAVSQRRCEGILSGRIRLGPKKLARRQALQAAQEVVVVTALLSVENVSKNFGGLKAISDVSLTVATGEICSVIGPNGAGKTTLFNLISGVLRPSAGRILFDGADLARISPWRFAAIGIGRTFQNLALFKHGTVVENILTGRHSHLRSSVLDAVLFFALTRSEEIDARRRVEEIIEFLEIEHIRDAVVGTLSYGQQKRVELARALACEPKLLLLDEMVSGMNQEETEDIARFVLDIRDELGITVVMIEHEMRIVMDISDSVHVLNFGRKIAAGTPDQVRGDPAVAEAYLGGHRESHAGQ